MSSIELHQSRAQITPIERIAASHPESTEEMSTMASAAKKVLIVMSDAASFPIKKGNSIQQHPSGFFLMELAKPLTALLEAGYEVTFASPKGNSPTPDPNSETLLAFAGNFYERRRENELIERMRKDNGFSSPRTFASISDQELASYKGVFIPGGHAPLADLGADPELGRILWHFHQQRKPTAAICHGPYAFLSTKVAPNSAGEFAYKGYKISCWSDTEEKMMEMMWGGEVPKVESALAAEGAEMVTGAGEKIGQITADKEVVSGGNPMAAGTLGEKFLQMLNGI